MVNYAVLRYHVRDGRTELYVDDALYVSKRELESMSKQSENVKFEHQHSKIEESQNKSIETYRIE